MDKTLFSPRQLSTLNLTSTSFFHGYLRSARKAAEEREKGRQNKETKGGPYMVEEVAVFRVPFMAPSEGSMHDLQGRDLVCPDKASARVSHTLSVRGEGTYPECHPVPGSSHHL